MKEHEYKVWFANCNYGPEHVAVRALNANEALILAQGERIRQGKDYTLHSIYEI